MAPVQDGHGVPPEDVDTDLLIQIRGSSANTSRIPKYHFSRGQCRAVEK